MCCGENVVDKQVGERRKVLHQMVLLVTGMMLLVSLSQLRTFSKTRISPLCRFLMAIFAFSPKTSLTYFTGHLRIFPRIAAVFERRIVWIAFPSLMREDNVFCAFLRQPP